MKTCVDGLDGRKRRFSKNDYVTVIGMSQFHLRVKSINNRSNMAGYLALMLFALISTLIVCLELNAALINLCTLILRKRQNLLRSFLRPKPYTRPRFWTRPGIQALGGTNYLVTGIFIPEEWRENFRMSRTSLLKLSELLRPFIQGETRKDYFSVSNSTLFVINIIFI